MHIDFLVSYVFGSLLKANGKHWKKRLIFF